MNIQRSNETHSLCVCVHFFYISVGFFVFLEWDIQSIAFFSYISRDELSLVLMEHWNNMAMNWTLLEPMLIADVHSVYGSGIAASSLHLCSLFLNWSFGLLCMHRNEFELNRSYFFLFFSHSSSLSSRARESQLVALLLHLRHCIRFVCCVRFVCFFLRVPVCGCKILNTRVAWLFSCTRWGNLTIWRNTPTSTTTTAAADSPPSLSLSFSLSHLFRLKFSFISCSISFSFVFSA